MTVILESPALAAVSIVLLQLLLLFLPWQGQLLEPQLWPHQCHITLQLLLPLVAVKSSLQWFGEMDQIKEMPLSGHRLEIVLILQTYFYFGRALTLGIIPASASPTVLFGQVLQVDCQEKGDIATGDSHFYATLDHQYSTDMLVLSLAPSPGLFNTKNIWQGPNICPLQPSQLKQKSPSISSRYIVYSSRHYANHSTELLNLSHKMSSLPSFPVEVHHYTTVSTRRFEQFYSSSHNQPPTFLPSVCPYSTVSTGHHSKNFVSTYSKTLKHGSRSLTMILDTESFLSNSIFHYFTQQHPPTLPSSLLLPHVAFWAARHSDPSSIYDGALAMLVKPSFTLWKIMLHTYAFLPTSAQLSAIPTTGNLSRHHFLEIVCFPYKIHIL